MHPSVNLGLKLIGVRGRVIAVAYAEKRAGCSTVEALRRVHAFETGELTEVVADCAAAGVTALWCSAMT